MAKNHLKRHLTVTVVIMVFIFVQSALPDVVSTQESGWISSFLAELLHVDPSAMSFVVRKAAHFTEYLALGASLMLTVRDYFFLRDRSAAEKLTKHLSVMACVVAWLIGTLYAVSDEIHQIFTPGRSCEIRDMLIDSLGVAVGVSLVRLWLCFIKRAKCSVSA